VYLSLFRPNPGLVVSCRHDDNLYWMYQRGAKPRDHTTLSSTTVRGALIVVYYSNTCDPATDHDEGGRVDRLGGEHWPNVDPCPWYGE